MDDMFFWLVLAILGLLLRGRDSQPTIVVNQPQPPPADGCAGTLTGLAILTVGFFGFLLWAAA